MASIKPDEELGNPFDWTEFYWGGFQPSSIGAVPLIDAFSKDKNSTINVILDDTRKQLQQTLKSNVVYSQNEIVCDDYFVTIHDEYEDVEDTQDSKDQTSTKQNTTTKDTAPSKREVTVARLWHKNVFIGVRGSGKANPGQFNFVAKFDAKSGKSLGFEPWQD
mmetsp:Transcript_28349/g.46586  ORF Transcript_28349/g.46586 Transcript_28349/m.46586 type:complete len:163 (-) Transcript_28349:8-496(-)